MPWAKPWTKAQDLFLTRAVKNGRYSVKEMAVLLGRTENAVRTRTSTLGLSNPVSRRERTSRTAQANYAKMTKEQKLRIYGSKNRRKKFAPQYEELRMTLIRNGKYTAADADQEVERQIHRDRKVG